MTITYTLIVLDADGDVPLEIDLTPDQAMPIIGSHIANLKNDLRIALESKPEVVEEQDVVVDKRTYKKQKDKDGERTKKVTHACCGSTGTRHFKTCANHTAPIDKGIGRPSRGNVMAGNEKYQALSNERPSRATAMPESGYDEARSLKYQDNMSPLAIADALLCPIGEVNLALGASTYEKYLAG